MYKQCKVVERPSSILYSLVTMIIIMLSKMHLYDKSPLVNDLTSLNWSDRSYQRKSNVIFYSSNIKDTLWKRTIASYLAEIRH